MTASESKNLFRYLLHLWWEEYKPPEMKLKPSAKLRGLEKLLFMTAGKMKRAAQQPAPPDVIGIAGGWKGCSYAEAFDVMRDYIDCRDSPDIG